MGMGKGKGKRELSDLSTRSQLGQGHELAFANSQDHGQATSSLLAPIASLESFAWEEKKLHFPDFRWMKDGTRFDRQTYFETVHLLILHQVNGEKYLDSPAVHPFPNPSFG